MSLVVQDHLIEIHFYRSHRIRLEREDDVEHVRRYETTLFVNVDRLLMMDGLIMCMSGRKKMFD